MKIPLNVLITLFSVYGMNQLILQKNTPNKIFLKCRIIHIKALF